MNNSYIFDLFPFIILSKNDLYTSYNNNKAIIKLYLFIHYKYNYLLIIITQIL